MTGAAAVAEAGAIEELLSLSGVEEGVRCKPLIAARFNTCPPLKSPRYRYVIHKKMV
jgi:hypothetical protein